MSSVRPGGIKQQKTQNSNSFWKFKPKFEISSCSMVVFRKANKIGFFIKVIPMLPDQEIKVRSKVKVMC